MSDRQTTFGPTSPQATSRPVPDDYVEFVRAGTRAKGQFECTACGHQIVTHSALPHCSGCGEGLWERSAWRPFAARRPSDTE